MVPSRILAILEEHAFGVSTRRLGSALPMHDGSVVHEGVNGACCEWARGLWERVAFSLRPPKDLAPKTIMIWRN